MTLEQSKWLTEKVLGKCWHKPLKFWVGQQYEYSCEGCAEPCYCSTYCIDFTSWQGFGTLWEAAKTKEWWWLFNCSLIYHDYFNHQPDKNDYDGFWDEQDIHPTRFADALYAFGQEHPELFEPLNNP